MSRFEAPPQHTGFTWVDTVASLREVARKLADVAAVAVDVEHNHTRSYFGTVCLLQLSDGTIGAISCPDVRRVRHTARQKPRSQRCNRCPEPGHPQQLLCNSSGAISLLKDSYRYRQAETSDVT